MNIIHLEDKNYDFVIIFFFLFMGSSVIIMVLDEGDEDEIRN